MCACQRMRTTSEVLEYFVKLHTMAQQRTDSGDFHNETVVHGRRPRSLPDCCVTCHTRQLGRCERVWVMTKTRLTLFHAVLECTMYFLNGLLSLHRVRMIRGGFHKYWFLGLCTHSNTFEKNPMRVSHSHGYLHVYNKKIITKSLLKA